MAIELAIVSAEKFRGSLYARFEDNTEIEIEMKALRDRIRDLEDDKDFLRMICLGYLLKRSADVSDLSSLLGRKMIFDLSHSNPLRTRIV